MSGMSKSMFTRRLQDRQSWFCKPGDLHVHIMVRLRGLLNVDFK